MIGHIEALLAAPPIRKRSTLLPQQRADARRELDNAERLGEVIVCAGLEARHAAGVVQEAGYMTTGICAVAGLAFMRRQISKPSISDNRRSTRLYSGQTNEVLWVNVLT